MKNSPKTILFLTAFLMFISVFSLESCKEKQAETIEKTSGPNTLEQNKAALERVSPANNSQVAGINPEHGQPGHRCDIPVGAPLSTPVQNSNPTNSLPINNGDSANGLTLNPAHGQPGHRCDIKVGDPLPNS